MTTTVTLLIRRLTSSFLRFPLTNTLFILRPHKGFSEKIFRFSISLGTSVILSVDVQVIMTLTLFVSRINRISTLTLVVTTSMTFVTTFYALATFTNIQ